MTGTAIAGKSHTSPLAGTEKVPLSPDGFATTQEIANLGSSSNATSIQGKPVSGTAPTNGQALIYNGSTYVPSSSIGRVVVAKNSNYTAVANDVVLADPSLRGANDGVTTNASPTVTSASIAFVAADVGKPITGSHIPANTYVGIVNSGTSIGLSSSATANTPVNATASDTGVVIQIGGPFSVTLPTPTSGATVVVKKTESSLSGVTVVGVIDGITNEVLTDPYAAHEYIADGANWWRI